MQPLPIPEAICPPGVSDITYMTLPTGDTSLSWRWQDRRYLIWLDAVGTPSTVVLSIRPGVAEPMQYYADSEPVIPIVKAIMGLGINAGLLPAPEGVT